MVPPSYELFNILFQVVTFFSIMIVISMEPIILGLIFVLLKRFSLGEGLFRAPSPLFIGRIDSSHI